MAESPQASRNERRRYKGLYLIAGHPGLDFLNTVKYRGRDDPEDALETFCDAVDWAFVAEVVDEGEASTLHSLSPTHATSARKCIKQICRFREDLRCLFAGPEWTNETFATAAIRVENMLERCRPKALINRYSGTLETHIDIEGLDDLLLRIADVTRTLLVQRNTLRLRCCDGDDCDWLYIDQSKAGRRRWCDTRTCGNAARVRRFRKSGKAIRPARDPHSETTIAT